MLTIKLAIAAVSLTIIIGCSGKENQPIQSRQNNVSRTAVQKAVLPPKVERPKYVFVGTKYPDPFVPLSGRGVVSVRTSGDSTFDPANLSLKGIIISDTEKIAMITDSGGKSYIVKNKRLFDDKREIVEGVVGIIKLESVIIITEDKAVRELRLNEDDAAAY